MPFCLHRREIVFPVTRRAYRLPVMRTLRLLLARTRLGTFLLLPLLSCAFPKPSAEEVGKALARSGPFVEPRTAIVPRRIDTRTDPSLGSGPLDDRQLSKVDGVLAILHMNKFVELEDVYAPDGDGGYRHVITVRPAADAPPALFTEVDEASTDQEWSRVRRTPGWRVALGHRKLIGVTQVLDSSSPAADRLSPGYVLASVDFKWVPTEVGEHFDQSSPAFDELPRELQIGATYAGDLDSGRTFSGRAWMTRGKEGKEWRVTLFQCQRCTTP